MGVERLSEQGILDVRVDVGRVVRNDKLRDGEVDDTEVWMMGGKRVSEYDGKKTAKTVEADLASSSGFC